LDPSTAPEPLDVLRVDKEIALLLALTNAHTAQLDRTGVMTSVHSRFLSVQDNGLLTGPETSAPECLRGLTPHTADLMQQLQTGDLAALQQEEKERIESRVQLKQRIADTRAKALLALANLNAQTE
jgi:hypothetical protein